MLYNRVANTLIFNFYSATALLFWLSELDVEIVAALITTGLSFGAGYGLSSLIEYQKNKRAKKTALCSLLHELERIQVELKNHVRTSEQIENTIAGFHKGRVNIGMFHLDHSAFDSAIYSGIFREFDLDVQMKISNVYEKIKFVNIVELRLVEMITSRTDASDDFVSNIDSYYRTLMATENQYLNEIAAAIGYLKPKA